MPDIDWSEMFYFTVSPFELIIRGTAIYLFLFCLFRFVVRRDTGTLSVSDMLVLVIIADAAQNGMAGEYKSVSDGCVLIGTIIGWNTLLNYLSFRFKPMRKIVLPHPVCIVRDGVKQRDKLRRELITDEELHQMLRHHEVEDLAQVRRAYLEPDGEITVLKNEKAKGGASTLPEHRVPGA
ncbi:MAG TPA: YetF domain-containing protein [Oxalicibacterium sp.]|nr:YetF domain-containing protein [Oxalicibacterium sp.]